MNPLNQQKASVLFDEKDRLRTALGEARKHKDWDTNLIVKCPMIQVSEFKFEYQDVTKLILAMMVRKMESRLNEIDEEIETL